VMYAVEIGPVRVPLEGGVDFVAVRRVPQGARGCLSAPAPPTAVELVGAVSWSILRDRESAEPLTREGPSRTGPTPPESMDSTTSHVAQSAGPTATENLSAFFELSVPLLLPRPFLLEQRLDRLVEFLLVGADARVPDDALGVEDEDRRPRLDVV